MHTSQPGGGGVRYSLCGSKLKVQIYEEGSVAHADRAPSPSDRPICTGKSLPETLLLGSVVLQGLPNAPGLPRFQRDRKPLLSSCLSSGL